MYLLSSQQALCFLLDHAHTKAAFNKSDCAHCKVMNVRALHLQITLVLGCDLAAPVFHKISLQLLWSQGERVGSNPRWTLRTPCPHPFHSSEPVTFAETSFHPSFEAHGLASFGALKEDYDAMSSVHSFAVPSRTL